MKCVTTLKKKENMKKFAIYANYINNIRVLTVIHDVYIYSNCIMC